MYWSAFLFYIRHFSVEDQQSIEKAFNLGEEAHKGQVRQSGESYFTHPIAVAQMLAKAGADRDTIIAALLHDTVEDTPLTLDKIEEIFGKTVSMLIDGTTRMEQSEIDKSPTLDEKIETLRKMFTLMQKDVRIVVIKLADRLHNMQTISFRSEEKQLAVAKETMDVYVKIADRLCMRDIRDELECRCREILEPEITEALIQLREKNYILGQEKIHLINERIAESFPELPLELIYENKSCEKLRLQYELEQEIPDMAKIINLIFRCPDTDSCYRTLGILHGLWPRESLTFEDFINLPVINGYKAIHTTVIMEDGTRVRCKIRTHEMDEYAHNGIATKCFDSQSLGVQKYLPWTQRISPLTNDTKDRSSEFWETLQSDILSESILVYGSTGRSALVPHTATALDAALYLFADKAMHLKAIRVNGKNVPLSEGIKPASTIEIITGPNITLHRDWLYWVQTGFGIAMIREELAKQSEGNLSSVGKNILQQALTDRGKGYLEEFDAKLLRQSVFLLGYNSPEDAYVAVANRHLEPSNVIDMLEQTSRRQKGAATGEQKAECTFRFTVDKDVSSLRRLLTVYERYNVKTRNIRLGLSDSRHLRMKINLLLTPTEQEAYRYELIAAGAEHITVKQSIRKELMLMAVVVLFWSLNPVWARSLIEEGVSALALVSLRSIIFFLFSSALYIGWLYMRAGAYSPIPRATTLAFAPALGTFILALLTYYSISLLPPSLHLLILRFSLLLPLIQFLCTQKGKKQLMLLPLLLLVAIGIAGFFLLPSVSNLGVVYALLALGSYLCYSMLTERTLQQHKIGIRYPHFLFHVGIILGVMGVVTLPLIMEDIDKWFNFLPYIFFYVLFCVFIPHTCFHIVLQRVRFRHIAGMSLIEVPLAILLEILILGLVLSAPTYGLIGALLVAFIVLLLRKRSIH